MIEADRPWCDPRFELTATMVDAAGRGWLQMLEENSLTVVASEISVINDEFRAAGNVDRFVSNATPLAFGAGDITIPAATTKITP